MKAEGVVGMRRRRSQAEAGRLVTEFEQSGLRRKEFCAAYGLKVHTLDAWRRRSAQSGIDEKLVAVEIIEGRKAGGARDSGSAARSGQFRILLSDGLGIEVETGFDAAELRRLVTALAGIELRGGMSLGM